MQIFFLISLGLHIAMALIMILGGDLSWMSTPKPPPTEIPVEFVPIAKESQGAISKPQIIDKEADKEEEKSEPKTETKPEDIKPEEKAKPKPVEPKKSEPVVEEKKEEPKPEKPKPVEKAEADPDGIPDKKKKDVKKDDKKKEQPKKEPVKDPKKDPKKDLKKKDKKEPPKKEDKKSKVDDDFEQILKNLDTKPAAAKDDKKKESKGKKKNVTNKLSDEASMSLADAMKRQVSQCWKLDAGVKDIETMSVVVHIKLKLDGTVESAEIVEQDKARMGRDSFYRAFAEGAKRAVLECAPYNLPPDMYDNEGGWKEIQLNFSPQDMLDQVQ